MMSNLCVSDPQALALINDLRKMLAEISWMEFKKNHADPYMIDKFISVFPNVARLADKLFAHMVRGIRNTDHATVRATSKPLSQMKKNQLLELWFSQRWAKATSSFESLITRE